MSRRSARLASAAKALKTAPLPKLESVVEREESPIDEPTPSIDAIMSSPMPPPHTPSAATTSVKPPRSEMHPSKVHMHTQPPSSALRLGFADINPPAAVRDLQKTPSKTSVPSSPFNFHFTSDVNLGPEAQRMMADTREEAAKIKADLAAKREQERLEESHVQGRKMARPKGKAGRFSAAHMAEFKKMDSIENHPSAFRANPTRITPAHKGIKRTQSKANLHDAETSRVKKQASFASSTKSSSSDEPVSSAKRVRKSLDDDASSGRPVSRDTSNIPRPTTAGKDSSGLPRSHSTLATLMTPTKASLARTASTKRAIAGESLLKSPSKPTWSGLKKSATVGNLDVAGIDTEELAATVQVQRPFDKVKSIFTKRKAVSTVSTTAIPKLKRGISKTPAPRHAERILPAAPLTTPGRKLSKRVVFTPETKRAALAQNSPSPLKSGMPRSKTSNNIVNYPSLASAMEDHSSDDVLYPDLSGHRPLPEPPVKNAAVTEKEQATTSTEVPSTFTFRSDHTIRFGDTSPNGFGGHPGQSSLRRVRPSVMPASSMPGEFPSGNTSSAMSSPNKENQPPQSLFNMKGFPHGMVNKKRHRVADDDEEAEMEAEQRAAKKQKQVPEGEELMAPRLVHHKAGSFASPKKSPLKSRIPGSVQAKPQSARKRGISLSRLNMLARPKYRK